MRKVKIGLIGCFLVALATTRAQDAGKPADGSTRPAQDTTMPSQQGAAVARDTANQPVPDTSYRYRADPSAAANDSVISLADDAPAKKKDTAVPSDNLPHVVSNVPIKIDSVKTDQAATDAPKADQQQPRDTATTEDKSEERTHELDRRWFISPLLKLQFQDYGMLEKNRKGYLSNANTLPFFQRGNASFAASAYKNLTQRLAISADLGLSFGHVTSNDVLISQTPSKTFNLLNAAVYYHLIGPSYRLQPYVTIGFNDIINDASYLTLPMGIGAKFNSKKIMVLGQVTYGYGLSKNNASTTMYSVGIYLPINSKKHKQLDQDDDKSWNKPGKDDAKKKDTTSKNGNVTNNIYITINMDSVLKAKGLLDDNGKPIMASSDGKRGDGDAGEDAQASAASRKKRPFRNLGLNDFNDGDYKVDSLDGQPVIRFVVYFEFNEYGLNSSAFNSIDKVIAHLKRSSEFTVEIKGYTDSVGSEQYNNMLSRKRAKMVLDYMNSRGVPSELMKAKAYGSDNPVADNSDPNQAWLNRRAEIIIHRKDQLASQ